MQKERIYCNRKPRLLRNWINIYADEDFLNRSDKLLKNDKNGTCLMKGSVDPFKLDLCNCIQYVFSLLGVR